MEWVELRFGRVGQGEPVKQRPHQNRANPSDAAGPASHPGRNITGMEDGSARTLDLSTIEGWFMRGSSVAELCEILLADNDTQSKQVAVIEPHYTKTLGQSPACVRLHLARIFLLAAGFSAELVWGKRSSEWTLLWGNDPALAGRYVRGDLRRVDLVVVDGRDNIILIVEVKGWTAQINGYDGYCWACGKKYACQFTCYGRHVLKAPKAKRLLVQPDCRSDGLKRHREWYAKRHIPVGGWKVMTLEALRDELAEMTYAMDPELATTAAALLQLQQYWLWSPLPVFSRPALTGLALGAIRPGRA